MRANRLYYRSEPGIAALPPACRPGIFAARLIYAGIGARIAETEYDSITTRARTNKAQKLVWLGEAGMRSGLSMLSPRAATLFADPLPECAFLVDAAAVGAPERGRSDALLDALATLAATDAGRGHSLMAGAARAS
jgi:phytoene synthase